MCAIHLEALQPPTPSSSHCPCQHGTRQRCSAKPSSAERTRPKRLRRGHLLYIVLDSEKREINKWFESPTRRPKTVYYFSCLIVVDRTIDVYKSNAGRRPTNVSFCGSCPRLVPIALTLFKQICHFPMEHEQSDRRNLRTVPPVGSMRVYTAKSCSPPPALNVSLWS